MAAVAGSGSGVAAPLAPAAGVAPEGRVLVVGTGVVGLCAALGAAQRGLRVSLVGPVPRPASTAAFDARIYALSEGARALLEAQRVWPQVDARRCSPVARMRIFGDAGGALAFDALAAGASRLATIVEETQLLQALWLACSLSPNIEHLPLAFDSLEPTPTGAQVRLSGGTLRAASLVLGADGRESAVRAAAGIRVRRRAYGHTAIVANFSTRQPHHEQAQQWFTDEGIVALLPLPGAAVSLVWSAPQELAPALLALEADAFARRVALRCGLAPDTLAVLGPPQSFVLERLVVERLVGPGLALMGDAAHVVHPLAGQGLNLGLQDVADFLRLLDAREPWRALGDRVFLRRYDRARAEPIALMRTTVDTLAGLFGTPDARVRRLRNLGLSAVNAVAPLKHALVRHALG